MPKKPYKFGPKPPRVFLREHRKDADKTLQYVADKIGVRRGTVSRWENQVRGVDFNDVAAFAGALGRRFDEMFSPPVPKPKQEPPAPSKADLDAIVAEVVKALDKRQRR